ncbi:MAG: hypothetical protein U1F68_04005 [Gammaproteobacteria bacterium]
MFEDEARFGRLSEPKRCWAAPGIRPRVCQQQVREYTYAYGAVSPLDGRADFLILPVMTTEAMRLLWRKSPSGIAKNTSCCCMTARLVTASEP